jgi:hypothetical protein
MEPAREENDTLSALRRDIKAGVEEMEALSDIAMAA